MISVRAVKIKSRTNGEPLLVYLFWCSCGNFRQKRRAKQGGFSLYEAHIDEETNEYKGKSSKKRIGFKYNQKIEMAIMCGDCYDHILRLDLLKRAEQCLKKKIPKELAEANGVPRI